MKSISLFKKNSSYIASFFAIVLLSIVTSLSACSDSDKDLVDEGEDEVVNLPSVDRASNTVLIYHGYQDRPKWRADQIQHYVYRENEGKVEWLFDGFLFLEIFAKLDGKTYAFEYAVEDRGFTPPNKKAMQWLIDETFRDNRGPDGLEQSLKALGKQGHWPAYKRKAIFCIPTPQVHAKEWGEIDGKVLDFRNQDDRVTGVKWYIDQVLLKWKEKNYKHLDFGGFYWLNEAIMGETDDAYVIRKVKDYLDEKQMELCWVPYYGAEGATSWKRTGIDYVFHQPNYFFNLDTPLWFLTNSIDIAKKNGGFMEMEFDENVAQEGFRKKFYDYIEQFEKGGVWETMPVAYYEGGGGWLKMVKSEDEEMKKMCKTLGDIVVKRNGKFSKIIKQ